jgi:uridine phosphorylase
MECAALIAAARFYNVTFGQYLAASDDVSGKSWNPRNTHDNLTFKESLFWLSVDACLNL